MVIFYLTCNPKRKRLLAESDKLHAELEHKLNSEEKELLERLLDINADESTLYGEDKPSKSKTGIYLSIPVLGIIYGSNSSAKLFS